MAGLGSDGMKDLWEKWFKVVLSLLLTVVGAIGVVLWNEVVNLQTATATLTTTTATLDGSVRTEIQARTDLSKNVDELKGWVQTLSGKIDNAPIGQTVPQADAASAALNKKLDQMSRQMYTLQSQLDAQASERSRKQAKERD